MQEMQETHEPKARREARGARDGAGRVKTAGVFRGRRRETRCKKCFHYKKNRR